MKSLLRVLILTYLIFAQSPSAFAEKMDSETQNLVIDRLEQIIATMDKTDASWPGSTLRLADLLAERARLRFMAEIEASCDGCKGSVADRKKALSLYESVFEKSKKSEQGNILFQIAHLHQIANEDNKAKTIYENILKAKKGVYTEDVTTQSLLALADLHFQKAKYKDAQKLYNQALEKAQATQKGFILYRLAWCQFNLGNLKLGISTLENLLGNKNLLVKQTEDGITEDPAFQLDVLHDLITFYTRNIVTPDKITKFQSYLPAQGKKELLLNFAEETSRLGQKQSAATIYEIYLNDTSLTKEERLNATLILAQTNYEHGSSKESLIVFAKAAAEYKDTSCDDEQCQALQKKMRSYVTNLHKSKKSRIDQEVLNAYDIYIQTFPKDIEMVVLGAQVAEDLTQYTKSSQWYANAANLWTKDSPAAVKESALLGEIETAEKSQDQNLREAAYKHYLKLSPDTEKSYEIRYQLAQLSYERKEWDQAANQFRKLALEKTKQTSLQKKSADLALDCLVLQKRDEDIETWSLDFANALPAHASEFQKLYRKSLNTQIVNVANNEKASSSELEKAIKKVKSANMKGASQSEQIMHYNNLAVLAKKAQNDEALLMAYEGLLALPFLSKADREETLASEVGFYEKKLDFKSAYRLALKMKLPNIKPSEKELKLGTLADLANLQPQNHYKRALQYKLSGAPETSVRQRLVMLSSNPASELKKHYSRLLRSPDLVSNMALLIYAKNHSARGLEFVLNDKRLERQAAITYIKKQSYYPKHSLLEQKISGLQLDTKSERTLTKSIQSRMKMLKQADLSLAEALRLRDFTAQIIALSTVKKENQRFAQDFLNLPQPQNLTKKEQVRYTSMLQKQMSPFLLKAKYADAKINDLWTQSAGWKNLIKDLMKSRAEIQYLISQDVHRLIELSPSSEIKSKLKDALNDSRLSQNNLNSMRVTVSKNPNDIEQIEKLITLETKIGHPLMVSYLELRIGQLHRRKTL